tara:strand:+ start:441 stop:632 length:192 start_codon:yes stop_codon:yes gene_type:complete
MTEQKIQMEDYNPTIICSICRQEKPVEEGCFIAISINNERIDRCKSCQDKIQRQVKRLKGELR